LRQQVVYRAGCEAIDCTIAQGARTQETGKQVNFNVEALGLEQPELIGRQQWKTGAADEVDGGNAHDGS
jgi:hypothetical protein